jgi:CDGSH-type Zn-finger protein
VPVISEALDDPRDRPGTDDHVRLVHPHGSSFSVVGVYRRDDLTDYVDMATEAHRVISSAYLVACGRAGYLPKPLCDGLHAEIVVSVDDLPHGNRPGARAQLAAAQAQEGVPMGLLRVWRHIGTDCEAAEREIACEHGGRP